MKITINEMEFVLRPATAADAPQIRELILKVLPEFVPSYDGSDPESDLDGMEQCYFEGGGTFLVVTHGDRVIASLGFMPLNRMEAKLRKMYVDPSYRKLGLGTLLLQQALRFAAEGGFEEIRLETLSSMTTAVSMYSRFGFINVPGAPVSERSDMIMKRLVAS